MFWKMTKAMAVAAAMVSTLLLSQETRAGLTLYAQEDGVNGSAITLIATSPNADFVGPGAVYSGDYGDFTLSFYGATAHNTTTLSSLLGGTFSIMNNSGSTQTINLYASQTNYSLPVGTPLAVESGLSGTVNTGTLTGSGVFHAFLDNSNTPLGMGFDNGAQNVVFDGSTFDTGSKFGSFPRTSANSLYSITSQVTATVSGGGEGNFVDHINVTAVPEPNTLAAAGVGLLTLGVFALRRRKKAFA